MASWSILTTIAKTFHYEILPENIRISAKIFFNISMGQKFVVQAIWFFAIISVCAILFWATGPSWRRNSLLPQPRPDIIATSSAAQGEIFIQNKSAGYGIVVPRAWHLEKNAGSGVTVYPDHDGTSTSPDCKIEISAFAVPGGTNLSLWLAAYLHQDPTADIVEMSRIATSVQGAPAILWTGVLNGILTTLAYVASGTEMYEIAPSVVLKAGETPSHEPCKNAFRTILGSFVFSKQ
jgi:hypothetical protein